MTKPVIKPSWAASDPKLYRRFRTLQLRVDRMIKKHTPKATLIRMAADKRGSAALEFSAALVVRTQ